MSEEMAVSDNTTGDEAKVSNDEATTSTVAEPEEVASEAPSEPAVPAVEEPSTLAKDAPDPEPEHKPMTAQPPEIKEEPESDDPYIPLGNTEIDLGIKKEEDDDVIDEIETFEHNLEDDVKRGIKRRASEALSDVADDEFKGFGEIKLEIIKTEDYSRILERLEAEVTAASKDLVPLRTVMATPPAPSRASKRARKDTDGSRPSSALSSRSDGDGGTDGSTTSSPAQRGRRATTEMSSPLLRVPLERGWKRELVFRAALDAHSRRNADIYYYTPQGKKLRSTREISEHLSGTGLTVENFSFFKEPLGVDDPEKEIIRDAKMIRRIESPVAATVVVPVEGKRTPKPKAPKGASPEPTPPATAAAANKSPPAKIKVKSLGSRLSNSAPPAAPTPPAKQTKKPQQQQQPQQQQPQQPPTTTTPATTDNNNSAAWKKPSGGECSALPARPPQPPPPLLCRPPPPREPDTKPEAGRGRLVQPCSMSCGRGAVPSLACAACLCLYHPACAGYAHLKPPDPFMCKNCRKSSSPPLEPPPLTHKSGVTTTSIPVPAPVPIPVPVVAPVPRRVPVPVPVPVPAKVPRDKRVLLRMKVAGGTPDGERVWAVAGAQPAPQAPPPQAPPPPPQPLPVPVPVSRPLPSPVPVSRARAPRPALPQGLAVFNGRRFIVVPRNMVNASAQNSAK